MITPEPGRPETLEPGLRRLLAPNPGPMTHWGTNTFILGEGRLAVVDPGPDLPAHMDALLVATRGETITHILVTHAHLDHSALAARLSKVTGAPVLAFGTPEAGRSPTMQALVEDDLTGGGEGVDHSFAPNARLAAGAVVVGHDWSVEVVHTPGHFSGHLAFALNDALLSGDHVMDWSSSLVSPPDGDVGAFMTTSKALRDAGHRRLYPAHGNFIDDPAERLGWLIAHRERRETQILNALQAKPCTVRTLTERVYTETPKEMLPAAERNVFAHLIDLAQRNFVCATPDLSINALFGTL